MPTKIFARSILALRGLIVICALVLFGSAHARDTPTNPLATIAASALPPEARATLKLIRDGGPFPYRRDGIEFQNRESRLPRKPRGYYREFTVKTPGEFDRGARRIIAGTAEEYYYTPDHYRSFRRISP